MTRLTSFVFASVLVSISLLGQTSWAQGEASTEAPAAPSDPSALLEELAAVRAVETGLDASALEGGPLAGMAYLVGDWVVDSSWSTGQSLWSYNEYRPILGGRYLLARTYAKDGDGAIYQRYETIFAAGEEPGEIELWSFGKDGHVNHTDATLTAADDGRSVYESRWLAGPSEVKQRVEQIDASSYRWQVWTRPSKEQDAEFVQAIDAVWNRVE